MEKQLVTFIIYIKKKIAYYFKKYDDRLPYILTAVVTSVIFIGGVKLFIELTEELKSKYLGQYDTAISQFVSNYRSPLLTDYFVFVTDLGDTIGYLVVFVVCAVTFYLIFKSWRYLLQLSLIMVLALSSNLLLKKFINRARPDVEHLVTVETLSYPSGHATMAMAFYGLLIYFVSQFPLTKRLKFFIIIILSIIILSIGLSRIYLGVHFPSDVAGGYIAGFVWVVFCVMIFNLIRVFKRDPST